METNYKEWLEFLNGENIYKDDSAFLKFVVLWISFNAYLNKKYSEILNCNGEHLGDCSKIEKFAKESFGEKLYNQLLENDEFGMLLEDFKITNASGREFVEDMNSTIIPKERVCFSENNKSFKDFILVLYQIRCNFLHGEKLPYDQNDQKLVDWAYEYLMTFWKNYIEKYPQPK
jgi:hypothetical protein